MESTRKLSAEDRFEIEDLLFGFMRSFDDKDWDQMRGGLAETIDCDYSSFRATPRGKVSRDDYVAQRRVALASLRTQHNLSNISIAGSGSQAEVKCNYAILRFHAEFDGSRDHYFHSYGQYRFIVESTAAGWKIAAITQLAVVNEGNSALHGALRK